MNDLVLVFLAGFVASFVDGALGMGFGPTSATILLSTGLAPAAVSTTVNLAKVATGLAAADLALAVRQHRPGARPAPGAPRHGRCAHRRDRAGQRRR